MSECASTACSCTTEPIIQPTAPAPLATGSAQAVYRIENMDCPTEEALIRSKLAGLAGVAGLEFNLMQRTLAVRNELPSLSPVEQALKAIGMQAVRMDQASAEQTTKLSIAKMDCPTEETLIRNKLGTVAGVADLDFNLMQRTLSVRHANQVLPDVLVALQALGFEAQVVDTAEVASPSAAPVTTPTNWWPLGISLVTASAAEAVYWLHNGNHWSVVVLALVAVFTGGLSTYKKGWIALKNRNLNMNALMSIAVTGAMLIGHWPEAAMVMVLFALAEVIEAKSLDRARNAIRGLLDLTPEQATVQQADGTWREVGAKQITIGARVRVKPGERIALDGEVLEGRSAVNQAPITGESLPVEKSPGDSVFAGTINESGSFEYRVTAVASNSTLARIIHAVEAAQGSRAPTQRFVDQFARWYTPVVFGVAIAVALLPPLFMGAAWLDWIYRALVLLVVACPCALVISTPVSIVSGLAAAAATAFSSRAASIWKKAASCAGWLWTRPARSRTASPHRPILSLGAMHSPQTAAASLPVWRLVPTTLYPKRWHKPRRRMGLPCSTWPNSTRCPVGVCKAKSTVRPTIWATTGCSKSWGSAHQSWSSASLRWKPLARPS